MIIYYKTITFAALTTSPLILISDIDDRNDGFITVKISGGDYSFLLLNGKRYPLNSGSVRICTNDVPNGLSEVIFVSGTKKLYASPFMKSECTIDRSPIDSSIAKALEQLLISLHKRLDTAEEKISLLEEKIIPKSILKFT